MIIILKGNLIEFAMTGQFDVIKNFT